MPDAVPIGHLIRTVYICWVPIDSTNYLVVKPVLTRAALRNHRREERHALIDCERGGHFAPIRAP